MLAELYYTYAHAQLCLTLYDSLYYSSPGSSVHGIFQARMLEWVAISTLANLAEQTQKILAEGKI